MVSSRGGAVEGLHVSRGFQWRSGLDGVHLEVRPLGGLIAGLVSRGCSSSSSIKGVQL